MNRPIAAAFIASLTIAAPAAAAQRNFTVTGNLSQGAVHVWSTNVRSNNSADHFVRGADLTPANGTFSLNVQPGYVYSITTTTGQGKGTATSPGQGTLSLPYSDTFDSYPVARQAKYLMDAQGSFEIVGCGGGRTGRCVRQMSEQAPIQWTSQLAEPYTLLGDLSWTNYTVSSDVMLEKERLRTAHRPCVHLPVPGTGQRQRPLPAGDPDRVMVDYEQ